MKHIKNAAFRRPISFPLAIPLLLCLALPVHADPLPTYTIVKDNTIPGIKRSVDVRLREEVTKEQLAKLAAVIKARRNVQVERTFITYYLPDMEVGAGAWATTHFKPNLEVRVLGLTKEQLPPPLASQQSTQDSTKTSPAKPSSTVLGRWIHQAIGGIYTIELRSGSAWLIREFGDGSRGEHILKGPLQTSKGQRFDDVKGGHGDYYIIRHDGRLESWDDLGHIRTLPAR